jgi:transcriptional regulator with XRE-family HTH domain
MDTVRLGRQVRALRRRRGWRQEDLARAAGLSQPTISRLELGAADELTIRSIERVARSLGARLQVLLSWNGESLDRLLDADHAALVERVADELRIAGWDVGVEASFAIGGERGSIDVLAFRASRATVLVVEVKSVVPDIQAMLSTLDRKARLAVRIAAGRGWTARSVARILVIGDTRTARRRIERHRVIFATSFPARNVAVRRWLADPDPSRPFSGLWFVSGIHGTSARHRIAPSTRSSHA